MLNVSKHRASSYIITLHGYSFTLDKMSEDKYWRLYNQYDVEVNAFETKRAALEILKSWTLQRTVETSLIREFQYA